MFPYRSYVLASLILLITIEVSDTQLDIFQYEQKRETVNEPRKYCGKSLTNNLQLICRRNGYYSQFKRSNKETDFNNYMLSNRLIPYKTIENAKKMLRFRRDSQGIYEECCLKPCTTEELQSYCASR